MKRKLTVDDYTLLRRMIRDIGPERIGQYFAVWYKLIPAKELKVRGRRQGAAFQTLLGFVRDYTPSCLGRTFAQICWELGKPVPTI